jgi:hypothetical protein
MKIVTWNIAGFRRTKSLKVWDYSDIDLPYFADEILKLDPDIINLQEVEFVIGRNQIKEFAKLVHMEHTLEIPMHPNHISEGEMGYAVISKDKITNVDSINQPYPSFELIFKNGQVAKRFDKQFVSYSTFGIRCTTIQLQPIGFWGYSYYEEPGLAYGHDVLQTLQSLDSEIITGDFQFTDLGLVSPELMKKYKDALPDEFTRVSNAGQPTRADHVLLKQTLKLLDSKVVKTQTDHFLCYAEFETQQA